MRTEYIDLVGFSTLRNAFDMYTQSYKELSDLNVPNNSIENQTNINAINEFLSKKKLDLKETERLYLQQKIPT